MYPDEVKPNDGDRDVQVICVDDVVHIELRSYVVDAEHDGIDWKNLSAWYCVQLYTIPIGDPKVFEKVPEYITPFVK